VIPLARRRALLAAGATPLLAAAARAPDLRARLARLRLGANLERWFAITRDNHPRRLGPEWWRGLRAAGFDHARIFVPEVKHTGEGTEVLAMYAEAVGDAVAAGLPVLLGMTDCLHHSAPWDERDWRAFAARAAFFAARADPAHVVLAPLNEPAFPDTATWLPVRDRLLGMMRRAAPRHVLMWGGREWCSQASLLETAPPSDPNTVAEVHDYAGGDAGAVEGRFAAVAAWRDRHRLPVLVSEINGPQPHATDRAAWAADLRQSLPVLRRLRLPAALWAYTHGTWWTLQPGDSPVPHPELRAVLRTVRSPPPARGGGGGTAVR
jgi:hypothetical protein